MPPAPGGGVPPSPPARGWCRELPSFPLGQPEPVPSPPGRPHRPVPTLVPSSHTGKVQTCAMKRKHIFPSAETKAFPFPALGNLDEAVG